MVAKSRLFGALHLNITVSQTFFSCGTIKIMEYMDYSTIFYMHNLWHWAVTMTVANTML